MAGHTAIKPPSVAQSFLAVRGQRLDDNVAHEDLLGLAHLNMPPPFAQIFPADTDRGLTPDQDRRYGEPALGVRGS